MTYYMMPVLVALTVACATVHEPVIVDGGAVAVSPTLEQEDTRVLKRKVAVLRFSNETRYGVGAFGGTYGVPIEKQAADILKTRLVESGKVILVDAEGLLGDADDLTRLKADYAIVGSVSEFGRRTSSKTGVFSRSKRQVAYAAVNLRLIDARTGKAVFAEEGAGEAEVETGRVLGIGEDAGYDSTLNDKAISSAISKLISNILENMMDSPWQTGILAVSEDGVMIAGGDEQGLLVGDVLIVKKRGRMVKDPQYGGEIELPRTEIGRIEVLSFFGSGLDSQGSVCKLVEGALAGHELADLVVEEVQ
jgi:curli biogenesis system outer membrane secretion channel CsgG